MTVRERLAGFWHRRRAVILAFVAGGVTAGALAGLFALAVVEFGLYNTTATKPHYRLVSWAAHKTFKRSTRLRARSIEPPPSFTQAQVISGFKQYQADCMMCHGGPGIARAHWVRGLVPTPPFLLNSGQKWSAAELDYILEEGVKMSAMPSWGETRSHDQIWSIVAFLKALPGISPAEFAKLQRHYPPDPFPPSPHVSVAHQ